MYFILIIQNGDTTVSFKYDSMEDAEAKFHTELAYRHESRNSTVCLIIDNMGRVLKMDSYYKSTVEE